MPADMDQEELIAQVVDLVVPLSNVDFREAGFRQQPRVFMSFMQGSLGSVQPVSVKRLCLP